MKSVIKYDAVSVGKSRRVLSKVGRQSECLERRRVTGKHEPTHLSN